MGHQVETSDRVIWRRELQAAAHVNERDGAPLDV